MFRGQRYDIFRILQGFLGKIIVYWLAGLTCQGTDTVLKTKLFK
jgi:hypothetical protein